MFDTLGPSFFTSVPPQASTLLGAVLLTISVRMLRGMRETSRRTRRQLRRRPMMRCVGVGVEVECGCSMCMYDKVTRFVNVCVCQCMYVCLCV